MFESRKILDYNNPEYKDVADIEKVLYIFHQRDYYGYYSIDEDRKLLSAQVYTTSYSGFYDDFGNFIADISNSFSQEESVSFIIDFNSLALIPEIYFNKDNAKGYFRVIDPKALNPQIQTVKSDQQDLQIVYNCNEQILPISIVLGKFPDAIIVPSSKGIIEQQHDFSAYINFSLRNRGLYHTYKSEGNLIDHGFTRIHYEADFLNTILHYVKHFELDKSEVVLVLDGYAEMASVLEDRLLNMDFRVARVQSSELGDLPEEFSFLPMYSFYNAYVNILCES